MSVDRDVSSMFARGVLRWLQTLNLSQTYTNPRVDFASGYLVADICSKCLPNISLHSFSDFLSPKMRADNWNQLSNIFTQHKIPINSALIQEVIQRKHGSAVRLIEILYTAFTHRKPVHAQIGEISAKAPEKASNVSLIVSPPDLPKPPEEQVPDAPPVIPKRQKFIGASASQRSGTTADLTPISFESASVVKSGPGFLQLRTATPQSALGTGDKALDQAVDKISIEANPENLQNFARVLDDPQRLTYFFVNYQADMVLNLLTKAAPYFSVESAPYIIGTIADIFIPSIDFEQDSPDSLIEFIFHQPCNDPFTHHFLLYKVLEAINPSQAPTILATFVNLETTFSRPLSQFILSKVRELSTHDHSNVLPDILTRLLNFDRSGTVQLIPLFAPTGDPQRDLKLASLYIHTPDESTDHIKFILQQGDRGIAAFILEHLIENENVARTTIIDLILLLPDPQNILTNEFTVGGIVVSPLIEKVKPLETAQLLVARVTHLQPDTLDKEIIVLAVLTKDLKNEEIQKWNELFQSLHEYLYLALCDENICKQSVEVCLTFYKLLQNEVFGTFANLFKALTYVFQSACPAACKATAIEFLTTASEIAPSFGQTVLKLLMNFQPKTHPDLDKLIVHLKKVRK
jgi:hypothetical protein